MKKAIPFYILILSINLPAIALDLASYKQNNTMYVNSPDGLRVRSKPRGDILFILEHGTSIKIIEDAIESNIENIDEVKGVWVKVKFYDDIGWVFSSFLVDQLNAVKGRKSEKNKNPLLSDLKYSENSYDRLLKFMRSPVESLPVYTFGIISPEFERGHETTGEDLLRGIKNTDGEIKLYSRYGPQGGNRWDTVLTKYLLVEFYRYENSLNGQIKVMAVGIKENSTIKLRFFNEWPDKESIITQFGNYNYENDNWYVYYLIRENVSLGFYHESGKIKQIVIRQYLFD